MSKGNGKWIENEDIVISGISGVFPQSENIEEFKRNLLAGKNLTTENPRWGADITDIPKTVGVVKTIDRFDHSFFRVHRKLAEKMDCTSRMLLEKTYEAVVDAGYNPQQLKGTNTGVFYGICSSEEPSDKFSSENVNEFTLLSQAKALTANRISYWLDINGPSIVLDTACSSSLYALECAYKSIRNGDCDAAIVCSSSIELTPFMSRAFFVLGILDADGKNRPFDAEADGFARAEAVVVVFMQKLADARRVYANVVHAKTNCDGFDQEGIAFPSAKFQYNLYEKFYNEINLDPHSVSYIEAHATGTKVGDIVEVNAIDKFFCTGRKTPLKIGSVKSNMGHSEPCSGLSSLIKLIIAFETGFIPPTINLKTLHPKMNGFHNGHIEVVTKLTPCHGELFGLNSFGVGGANAHVLLSPQKKVKKLSNSTTGDQLPRIVTVSGRTEEAVNVIVNELEKNHSDIEYIRLMHEVFSEDISGHLYRGYVILNKEKQSKKHHKFFSGEKRPIWYVFSGMGSQWPGMGKSLMRIPLFAESIRKCHEILQSKGINLIKIITDNDPQIFNNIFNSFVGITSVQIALCDVLRSLNIKPDGIIGHSLGEIACAYADGCFTAEQAILAAYYRGLVSLETKFIHGTMAAVGVSYDVAKNLIPPEIDIACHNGTNSCTISGPTDIVEDFMKELKSKDIFVHGVNTSNIAFHSRYIASAGSKLMSCLSKIIPDPKPRSDKWICTSVPEREWHTKKAKYSSAEYHTNNLLNPVYFEESSRRIPENAITIEIAPHGLLQSILKRSLPSTTDNISLTIKDHNDGVEFLLGALGQLYEVGCVPKLSNLYPPVPFPVSKSTPMISPFIRWQHDEVWPVAKHSKKTTMTANRDVLIDYQHDDFMYLRGHVIDGRNIYPAFGYLGLIWETMALVQGKDLKQLPIVFEDVRFERATNIPEQGKSSFHISIQRGSGRFEITENQAVVVCGVVRVPEDIDKEKIHVSTIDDEIPDDTNTVPLSKKDFYKEFRLRGYHYNGLFKNVVSCNTKGTFGKTSWCDNFVTFIDTMAQITILDVHVRELIVPTFIRKVVIDVKKHFEILQTLDSEKPEFPVHHYPHFALTCSGGVQLIALKGTSIARKKDQADPVLEKYQFVPYNSDQVTDLSTAIRLCVHIVLENLLTLKINTIQLSDRQPHETDIPLISKAIANAASDLPTVQANVSVLTNSVTETAPEDSHGITVLNGELPNDKSCAIIVLSDIQNKADMLDKIYDALKEDAFIISEEHLSQNKIFHMLGLDVCFSRAINAQRKIVLLRKTTQSTSSPAVIRIENTSHAWISKTQQIISNLDTSDGKLVVYSEKEPLSGILGFFNCLRKEQNGDKTRCFFLVDENASNFSLQNSFYRYQYDRNLSHNVYKNGQWGSYRHLPLEPVSDVEVTHAFNAIQSRGDLSSLRWVQGSLHPTTRSSEKLLIHVYYSAINFRDVMLTTGKISALDTASYGRLDENHHGIEFSGKDENGVRYIGTTKNKGFASLLEADPMRIWRVPDHMTLEEASTIAVAYSTVIYAFMVTMNLREGSSVLIHAASGAVGQAAINICLHYNCKIFVTVGTSEKVNFIKKTFPQIPERNIGNSRDTSFEKLIMKQTLGRGVDVVLNSLSEEKLRASVRCVAQHGYFIEIGKFDLAKNNSLELGPFLQGIKFLSIQLDLLHSAPIDEQLTWQRTVQDMIDSGIAKPICRTTFDVDEVESAIRFMAAGKHIGKVIIKIRDEENDIHTKPVPIRLRAQSRVVCQENNSYVIIGGLGGFGLELAGWLIIRGARNIVLSSRNGLKNGYQYYKIQLWRSYGVNVVLSTEDVTTETGVANLLKTANSLGPVIGIFNLAVILKDDPFHDQTEETFVTSAGPKAIATTHLDKQSRLLCPRLEHFVAFSSVSCGRGNLHQTNYGMSNSIMERICEGRRADNLPALAIQWGAIGEVGVVADFAEDNQCIVIGGTLQQKVSSCLQTLDHLMKQSNTIVASMIVAEKRYADSDIINIVANILGVKDLQTISLTWTLPELGMDSIMSVELKQIVESEFDVFLSPQDLKTMTFAKLYKLKEEKAKSSKAGEKSKTQYQQLFDENILNLPLLRIPFPKDGLAEEMSIPEQPLVFMFPGVEGIAKFMEPLAINLNVQSLCFQYTFDIANPTFEKYCEYFAQHITTRLRVGQNFHIVAHSVGTIFALEVAKIMEKQGQNGHLSFIDGSPDYVRKANENLYAKGNLTDDDTLQDFVCITVAKALASEWSNDDFVNRLRKLDGWESKKTFCCTVIPKNLWKVSTIHKFVDRIYTYMKDLKDYQYVGELLATSCTLIRTRENKYNLDTFYGLSKYFKHPVVVSQIDADHFSIIEHKQTANIIMENVNLDEV